VGGMTLSGREHLVVGDHSPQGRGIAFSGFQNVGQFAEFHVVGAAGFGVGSAGAARGSGRIFSK
jgi:hypothetical protein